MTDIIIHTMTQKLSQLLSLMQQASIESLVLNPSPTFSYLTGLSFHMSERPVILWLKNSGQAALVVPELERIKAEKCQVPVEIFTYPDQPALIKQAYKNAGDWMAVSNPQVGVEPNHLRYLEMEYLQPLIAGIEFVNVESILSSIRVTKSAEEVESIQKAVYIAEAAFLAFCKQVKPGLSELQAANLLISELLKAGSHFPLPFHPIIAAGPNSANPHAYPSERKIEPGDLVVVDWGANYQGYISDLTRMLAVPPIAQSFTHIRQVVSNANLAAQQLVMPGKTCGDIDRAARQAIEQAGFGPNFTHRVGHGIGLETHEPPYLFGENKTILQTGMTFTIEPGIYLPGQGGVRLEDNMVVTEYGSQRLSNLSHDFYIIGEN